MLLNNPKLLSEIAPDRRFDSETVVDMQRFVVQRLRRQVDELKASGLLDTRPAGTIIGDTGEMYNDAQAEGAPEEEEPEALDDGDDVNSENAETGDDGQTEAEARTG